MSSANRILTAVILACSVTSLAEAEPLRKVRVYVSGFFTGAGASDAVAPDYGMYARTHVTLRLQQLARLDVTTDEEPICNLDSRVDSGRVGAADVPHGAASSYYRVSGSLRPRMGSDARVFELVLGYQVTAVQDCE